MCANRLVVNLGESHFESQLHSESHVNLSFLEYMEHIDLLLLK